MVFSRVTDSERMDAVSGWTQRADGRKERMVEERGWPKRADGRRERMVEERGERMAAEKE
jgi:hypothetical protein